MKIAFEDVSGIIDTFQNVQWADKPIIDKQVKRLSIELNSSFKLEKVFGIGVFRNTEERRKK